MVIISGLGPLKLHKKGGRGVQLWSSPAACLRLHLLSKGYALEVLGQPNRASLLEEELLRVIGIQPEDIPPTEAGLGYIPEVIPANLTGTNQKGYIGKSISDALVPCHSPIWI